MILFSRTFIVSAVHERVHIEANVPAVVIVDSSEPAAVVDPDPGVEHDTCEQGLGGD